MELLVMVLVGVVTGLVIAMALLGSRPVHIRVGQVDREQVDSGNGCFGLLAVMAVLAIFLAALSNGV